MSGPAPATRPIGRPSRQPTSLGEREARPGVSLSPEDIASKIRMSYEHGPKDQTQRAIEVLQALLDLLRNEELDIHALNDKAARMIHQQFRLSWVAIGLRDPSDGLYRYDALVGFREDAAQARRRQAFTLSDFDGKTTYRGRQISDQLMIYLEEDKPYTDGAEDTFNRPALLESKRRSPEQSLEADYVDVNIFGPGKELLGWIEVSGTVTGKLPDLMTMKWMEIIASIIGAALVRQRLLRAPRQA